MCHISMVPMQEKWKTSCLIKTSSITKINSILPSSVFKRLLFNYCTIFKRLFFNQSLYTSMLKPSPLRTLFKQASLSLSLSAQIDYDTYTSTHPHPCPTTKLLGTIEPARPRFPPPSTTPPRLHHSIPSSPVIHSMGADVLVDLGRSIDRASQRAGEEMGVWITDCVSFIVPIMKKKGMDEEKK